MPPEPRDTAVTARGRNRDGSGEGGTDEFGESKRRFEGWGIVTYSDGSRIWNRVPKFIFLGVPPWRQQQ